MEEGVVDDGDGAVELGLDAVVKLEGPAGLVTYGEGDPLDLVAGVLDVLARLSVAVIVVVISPRNPWSICVHTWMGT